ARASFDLAVYRDQLAELERDLARGVLTPDQAAAARLEIERRMLAAADAEGTAMKPPKSSAMSRWPGWFVAAGVPLAALLLYLQLGQPDLPLQPQAQRPATADGDVPEDHSDPELTALATQLAERLAADPSDAKGWQLLGRTYNVLRRFADSAAAYAQAIERGAADPAVYSAYGEALTMAANGEVTALARRAFEDALLTDPEETRARYYIALAQAQAGRLKEALDLWVKLEADAPADAPWLPGVTARVEQTAKLLELDAATLPGRRVPVAASAGPTGEDMAAAADLSPEERQAFIRGMVDRLAARLVQQPNDVEGWTRLAASYSVLGDPRKSRDAWQRAAALAPDRVDIQQSYAEAMLGVHLMERGAGPFPPGFSEIVARIRALDPQSGFGLFYGGALAEAAGDKPAARSLWQQLLARLPEASPEQTELKRRLDALGAGG
ncbi:MAG: c-type cytochrome biogenesis protein CcmI, partial [Dongiaceae bacterium]